MTTEYAEYTDGNGLGFEQKIAKVAKGRAVTAGKKVNRETCEGCEHGKGILTTEHAEYTDGNGFGI